MMPFSSVAMIEKLARVRIAFCNAPVLSNAFWRRTSVLPCALPASSARVGPFPVFDMVDFREKRATIRRMAALVGPATEDCGLHSRKKPLSLPRGGRIIAVFPAAVCALAHTSRSMMPGFARLGGLPDQVNARVGSGPLCARAGDEVRHLRRTAANRVTRADIDEADVIA